VQPDGTVFGNRVAVVALKPLQAAIVMRTPGRHPRSAVNDGSIIGYAA
jgi:hypothetical protein